MTLESRGALKVAGKLFAIRVAFLIVQSLLRQCFRRDSEASRAREFVAVTQFDLRLSESMLGRISG